MPNPRRFLETSSFEPNGLDGGVGEYQPRFHWHDEVELNFVERGAVTYLFGGEHVTVRTRRLAVFWGATPHQIAALETDTVFSWLTLPLEWILQWNLPCGFVPLLMQGDILQEADGQTSQLDALLFPRWLDEICSREDERQKTSLLEIEARLRRLSRQVQPLRRDKETSSGGRGEMRHIERMARFVAARHAESIHIGDIAAVTGLHPNYAMTLFRRITGLSLSEYLTRSRVSHAQRLLLTTDAKITNIALDAGFGSLSAFYASFQQVCGHSPGDYRKRGQV